MAEILPKEHKQKAGRPKAKKSSLTVDLTPMVDLGFLLISFFVFTTTISQPMAMKLVMPDDQDVKNPDKAPDKKTLNLILGSKNTTYVYNGLQLNAIRNIGSNKTAIRDAILQKKNEMRKLYGSDSDMIILIKPTYDATYENVVNALDEMLICNIKTYVLMDAAADELKAVRK
ncbi:MAG: biopolymer transporter ExbD [Parafilimonas sp.]|nr:biopolymer transporter ExbD [Parafilimonas sp.]